MSFLSGWNIAGKRLALQDDDGTALWGGDSYRPSQQQVGVDVRRKGCANRHCQATFGKPWKSQRRPIFEGNWGCGTKCLEAMIRSAVRRELNDGPIADGAEHIHRVPLGLVLLAQGWITHPQLRKALDGQKASGVGKIGEWLQQECGVSEETVTRGLSVQWNCPVLSTETFQPSKVALAIPKVFVDEFGLLPLRIAGQMILYLGFEDRLDASAAFALQQMTELRVESGLVRHEEFVAARERLSRSEFVTAKRVLSRTPEELTGKIAETLEKLQPIGAKLVRMHQYFWLRTWLETGTQGLAGTVPDSTEDVQDTIFSVGAQA